MVVIVIESWYPAKISPLVGQKYIEVMQKYPPDESLGETALNPILRATKDGVHVLQAWKCKDDKVKDSVIMLAKIQQMFVGLEGYQYSMNTYVDVTEAYTIIGAKGP
jgi:hypothetical protein